MKHRYLRPRWGAGVIVALLTVACALQKRIHQLREDQRLAPETQLAYLGNHMVEQRTEASSPCATINKEMAALLDEHALLRERALELERRVSKPSHLMLLPRDDGFGAQLHGVMAALAYTKGENMVYVRTPWRHVAHGPPNVPAEEWAWRLESFAGVAMAELTYSSGLGLIPAIANVHSLVERDVNRYYTASVLELLQSRYATALSDAKRNSPAFLQAVGKTRVAVHVRRGDVDGAGNEKERFTSNDATLDLMHWVSASIAEQATNVSLPVMFHIYSEGASMTLRTSTGTFLPKPWPSISTKISVQPSTTSFLLKFSSWPKAVSVTRPPYYLEGTCIIKRFGTPP